ncbi:hypothetical protein CR513_40870, partial [Mucuna pruriens]
MTLGEVVEYSGSMTMVVDLDIKKEVNIVFSFLANQHEVFLREAYIVLLHQRGVRDPRFQEILGCPYHNIIFDKFALSFGDQDETQLSLLHAKKWSL